MKKVTLKIVFIFSFFLFQTLISTAQEYNQVDKNGNKHGLWKGFYPDSKRPRYEGSFLDGNESGIFTYFDDTKAKSIIATRTFSENGKVAYTIFYNQKKNVVSEGKTINRLNEGIWKYYHQDSKEIKIVENYLKGKLTGTSKVFYKNKAVAEETSYLNGIKNGSYKKYTEKGMVLEESNFKNGQYDGIAIFRDTNGDIASKGPFVNGAKKGLWQFYANGKLTKEEVLPIVKKFGKSSRK